LKGEETELVVEVGAERVTTGLGKVLSI